MMRRLSLSLLTLIPIVLSACDEGGKPSTRPAATTDKASGKEPTDESSGKAQLPPYVRVAYDHPSNIFGNASFESEERKPWGSMADGFSKAWKDWEVTTDRPKTGKKSAKLILEATSEPLDFRTRVTGAVFGNQPDTVPRTINGSYFVEEWRRGPPRQYLQVVVSVFNCKEVETRLDAPVQVAWVLAGVDKAPSNMSNRRFIMHGPKEPVVGEWIDFDIDVHQAFLDEWGLVPSEFKGMRTFFEVRYDQIHDHQRERVNAVVYYDDLYMGDGG